jgi:acyl dehydratase
VTRLGELYFEDFTPGRQFQSSTATVTEADILDFARRFDPQVFHLDPEAAKTTPFGGLIASGIHTIALTFSLVLRTGMLAASSLGSPGLDDVRWRVPVRPGDTLRVIAEVLSARSSRSKPDRGIVTMRYRTFNQRSEEVMTMTGNQLVRRRAPAPS